MHVTHKMNFERKASKLCEKKLEKVEHHLYLGVKLTHDLKWNQHIRNTSRKANCPIAWPIALELVPLQRKSQGDSIYSSCEA